MSNTYQDDDAVIAEKYWRRRFARLHAAVSKIALELADPDTKQALLKALDSAE